eukprot:TRINITY_DN3389_c0_g4_i1.p1 TRINITY_DN3389_c0_g4~~TRINITY_DN3389_c0_g4_i1.p1  ORF type:complete len:225 (+),score=4.61 TRINITY_DN3389_c0_g4_i1:99-677(+)
MGADDGEIFAVSFKPLTRRRASPSDRNKRGRSETSGSVRKRRRAGAAASSGSESQTVESAHMNAVPTFAATIWRHAADPSPLHVNVDSDKPLRSALDVHLRSYSIGKYLVEVPGHAAIGDVARARELDLAQSPLDLGWGTSDDPGVVRRLCLVDCEQMNSAERLVPGLKRLQVSQGADGRAVFQRRQMPFPP